MITLNPVNIALNCNRQASFAAQDKERTNSIFAEESLLPEQDFAARNAEKIQELRGDGVIIVDPNSTWISQKTEIGEGTVIYPGTYMQGKNNIGAKNSIGPNAFIGGDVTTGEGVKIIQSNVSDTKFRAGAFIGPFAVTRSDSEVGPGGRIGMFTEVVRSTVGEGSEIPHLSFIGDAEIGKNVNIGAAFVTSNYNPITETKSKTIIRDNAMIGAQVLAQAPFKRNKGDAQEPLIIGEKALVANKSFINKNVPDGALAIARAEQTNRENWVTNLVQRHS